MYLTPRDGQPSTRAFAPFTNSAPACAPVAVLRSPEAQVSLLGSPAVSVRALRSMFGSQASPKVAPISELPVTGGPSTKINNSIGTSAKGEGLTMSVAAAQDHQVQTDAVKSRMAMAINARGVPPRGRPV